MTIEQQMREKLAEDLATVVKYSHDSHFFADLRAILNARGIKEQNVSVSEPMMHCSGYCHGIMSEIERKSRVWPGQGPAFSGGWDWDDLTASQQDEQDHIAAESERLDNLTKER